MGDFAAAAERAEEALAAAERDGTPDDVAAAHEALAIVSHFQGRWRDGLLEELARLGGDSGSTLARVSDLHHCIGQYHLYGDSLHDSVEAYARRLLDLAEAEGATRAQAFAWCLLGESLLLQARWEEAEGCLARSCDLHASISSRSGALAWQRRAELAVCLGEHDQARALLREASALATVSPMAMHLWGRIYATAAFSAVEQRDWQRAVRSVQSALAAKTSYGDCPSCSALINPIAAEAYSHGDDSQNAMAYAEAAAGVAQMFASSAWSAMAESAAGSAAIADGELARADEHFARARALYNAAGQPYWAERASRLAAP
jgi:tetratricopeptide (TPR) repeat protein